MSKSVLVDTSIPANADKEMLRAFLHGHTSGDYKFYKELENKKYSIKFSCGEDATNFELKKLDKVFVDEFHKKKSRSSVKLDDESVWQAAMRNAAILNHKNP